MQQAFRRPPDLQSHLKRLLAQTPAGKATTYGALAKALGNVVASRWVGHFLLHGEPAAAWPTHRVVRADGELGLFRHGSSEEKARLLETEGVPVGEGRVDLSQYGVAEFAGPRPLARLQAAQDRLAAGVDIARLLADPGTVAGLDVSYHGSGRGVGSYTLFDTVGGELIWSTTAVQDVRFPYISSYLAFRELPILLELVDRARRAGRLADVLLVDGAGVMHPRRAGVASHLGVLVRLPTIGVIKKLLCGRVVEPWTQPPGAAAAFAAVNDGDERLGAAVRVRRTSKRLLYASPGHLVDIESALRITIDCLRGRRLPEPIYWADRLSRQAAAAL